MAAKNPVQVLIILSGFTWVPEDLRTLVYGTPCHERNQTTIIESLINAFFAVIGRDRRLCDGYRMSKALQAYAARGMFTKDVLYVYVYDDLSTTMTPFLDSYAAAGTSGMVSNG